VTQKYSNTRPVSRSHRKPASSDSSTTLGFERHDLEGPARAVRRLRQRRHDRGLELFARRRERLHASACGEECVRLAVARDTGDGHVVGVERHQLDGVDAREVPLDFWIGDDW
jgi:hypothetical protein